MHASLALALSVLALAQPVHIYMCMCGVCSVCMQMSYRVAECSAAPCSVAQWQQLSLYSKHLRARLQLTVAAVAQMKPD
jgi:hypothetical protein